MIPGSHRNCSRKSKERPIKEALLTDDLPAVRRLVNGGTHGLAQFEEAFHIGESILPLDVQPSAIGTTA